jgi:hypothetical protein
MVLVVAVLLTQVNGWQVRVGSTTGLLWRRQVVTRTPTLCKMSSASCEDSQDNRAMAFLRKIGRVGGANHDYTNALGIDEGPSGKSFSTTVGTV